MEAAAIPIPPASPPATSGSTSGPQISVFPRRRPGPGAPSSCSTECLVGSSFAALLDSGKIIFPSHQHELISQYAT
ncbi:hypothetical protein GUJ93_ZPchr0004g38336 [Zizania palustris]|uniref:Uncharacterized protein n=1 Tax=Zizania palustris TaxID=103762 RepID=A0A8J5S0N3_ZIZPA|nr:hypothetical protein GUJ93_ZPchr0004g38336 [Zizania palustris]